MRVTKKQLETPIAKLEEYGLSPSAIDFLEERFKAVLVRDLMPLTDEQLLAEVGFGEKTLKQIRVAQRRFIEDK